MNIQHFKDLLTKEAKTLEEELASIGRKNPDEKGDWEAVATNLDDDNADEFDVAEDMGNFENNRAELNQLEIQLKNVRVALQKIENETYGVCEIGGEQIEEDRLEANPSATTCKAHME